MTRLTNRDDFLKAEDSATEEVSLDGIKGFDGMTVLVRGLTGRQRDEWEATMVERRGKRMVQNTANIRAKLVARCVIDDEGKRIFTDGDVDEIGEKSAAALDRIYEVAARLSGVTEDDVEEMVENFGKMTGDTSPSTSPSDSERPETSSSDSPTAENSLSGSPSAS